MTKQTFSNKCYAFMKKPYSPKNLVHVQNIWGGARDFEDMLDDIIDMLYTVDEDYTLESYRTDLEAV